MVLQIFLWLVSLWVIKARSRFSSDYHPDTWNPAWSVATILTGLLSFMLEKSPTLGSIETSDADKRSLAAQSHEFNLKSNTFCELFPDQAEKSRKTLEMQKAWTAQKLTSNGGPTSGNVDPRFAARQTLERNQGQGIQGAVTNFLVIGGFAAFAFVVQYVLQNIATAAEH